MALPVTLLSFHIDDIGNQFDEALKRLPLTEHSSVLRYKFEKDRRLSLGGRLLRRYYYSKKLNIPWHNLEFYLQPDGKPALVHSDWTDFNISHDGNWVIFGATEKPGITIGVDVVALNQDTYGPIPQFITSFKDQLMKNELEWLGSIKNEHHRLTTFYQIWGLKESYIKAIGKGLALDLDQFCILPQQQQQQQQRAFNKDARVQSSGSTTTTERLKLITKGQGSNSNIVNDHWCFHLGYLDSQSINVVCCGSNKDTFLLDKDFVRLEETTSNLGDMYNGQQTSIFTRLDLKSLLS